MAKTTTTVKILPSIAASYASAMRGNISSALAFMRIGAEDEMETALKQLRRTSAEFERECRSAILREAM